MQNKAVNALQDFVRQESASGIILIAAMLLAMLLANSPFDPLYEWILDLTIAVQIGSLEIHKPLLMWVNDEVIEVN